ncbi:unnamed protein product [Rhizophagus irregularis]|nr:unnamed protein product [Rhizophagus irregularis]CAB4432716.1 unnamed protein product [Rhizophagus irregularis]
MITKRPIDVQLDLSQDASMDIKSYKLLDVWKTNLHPKILKINGCFGGNVVEEIEPEILENLVESMPRRIQVVMDSNGYLTNL